MDPTEAFRMFDDDGSGNMDRMEIVQVDDQQKRERRGERVHLSLFIKCVKGCCLGAGNECAWSDERQTVFANAHALAHKAAY